MPIKTVEPYPRWYTPVKWLLPITLALMAGFAISLTLLGFVPIPMMFGKLAWLPAIYKSLEGFKAAAALVGSFSLVSSFVGLSTAFILRATVLFYENEKRGTQGLQAQAMLEEQIDIGLQTTQTALDLEAQLSEQKALVATYRSKKYALKEELKQMRAKEPAPHPDIQPEPDSASDWRQEPVEKSKTRKKSSSKKSH